MHNKDSNTIIISGVGLDHPDECISNEELVSTFNTYVNNFNSKHSEEIKAKTIEPLKYSSSGFIEKISGIKQRYVRDKKSILDPNVMAPLIPERKDNEVSLQAEVCIKAAKKAIYDAKKTSKDIDLIIVSGSHKQRDYPAISVEVQSVLGTNGFAYDMGAACSSSTFGIASAYSHIKSGLANTVLLINPEIKSGLTSYRDRESFFIFGEATTALIIERKTTCKKATAFQIVDLSLLTEFSNNIRNNRGAYNYCAPDGIFKRDKFFYQNGRAVFKEVTKLASELIKTQLAKLKIKPSKISKFWLHQSNAHMIRIIIKRLIGKNYDKSKAPTTLEKYGNTSSTVAIIAFYHTQDEVNVNDICILCSYGAGYTIGSIILQKIRIEEKNEL